MYGTVPGVEALSAQWTNNGLFLDADVYQDATNPSLTQVEDWLTRVSDAVDARLSDGGFNVPVTVPAVISDISMLVEGIVKDLADFSHGSGRYYSKQALESGSSPYLLIDKEVSAWVARRTLGFTALGVSRRGNPARNDATFEVM